MTEHATDETAQVDPLEHPAVRAWSQLRPARVEPREVSLLRRKRKSAVYRLAGVGPGACDVAAKRCRRAAAWIERTVYAEILPHLSLPTLGYYGSVEEPGGEWCWLFLEPLSGEKYSPPLEEHRRLAGRWLGLLHTSAERLAGVVRLPDRGPGHYRERLPSVRDALLRHLARPGLQADHVAVLKAVVAQCEALAARWGRVEELCEGMPRTLVHGDFIKRNLRVRPGPTGSALVAFDWETAGWGVPAVDLTPPPFSGNPDLAAYWAVVREHWPRLDLPAVRRWADLAALFRCLTAIDWETLKLPDDPTRKPTVGRLGLYHDTLAQAVRASGWED